MENEQATSLHGRHVLVLGSGTLQSARQVPRDRTAWLRRHHLYSQVRRGASGGGCDSQGPPPAPHDSGGHGLHEQREHRRWRGWGRRIYATSLLIVALFLPIIVGGCRT